MSDELVPTSPKWDPQRPPVLALLNDAPLREDECEAECFELGSRMGILYDAARHPEMRTPFAAMVSGGWGTGKTSSMRWLDQQLKLWKADGPEGRVVVDTCWFFPWKYQSAEDVWKGLIAEVIFATLETNDQDVGKVVKAAKQFGMFLGSGFVRLLGAIKPKVGDARTMGVEAQFDVKEALSGVIEEYGKHVTPQKAYYNAFEDALRSWVKDVYKEDRRLVIFIDDLDRCMPDIALQVLEALKLYLNIENLVFIVGVDKTVIERIVAKRYEDIIGKDRMSEKLEDERTFADKAAQYLDKMFQIEVNVQPTEPQVDGFLEQRLAAVSWWNEVSEDHRRYLLYALRRSARHNPRAVVRKINQILVAAGGNSDAVRRVQAIQAVLLSEACEQAKSSAWRTREGFRFFYAWSQALVQMEGTFLPPGQDREVKTGEPGSDVEREDPFRPLREVGRSFPDLAHLLHIESIGLLMRLPYPSPSFASSLAEAVGVQETPEWVEALRPLISQATGHTLEEIDEEFLTGLTALNLGGTSVTDAGLAHLQSLTGLTKLELSGTSVTDAGLAHLQSLRGLTTLNLARTSMTDAGLDNLRPLTGLTSLNLARTSVTDAGLVNLQSLRGLKMLNLARTSVTDAGLVNLQSLRGLKMLNLDGTSVTDAGLAHLQSLTGLTRLYLLETSVTDAGLVNLQSMTRLTILDLDGTNVTDAGLVHLQSLNRLTSLYLSETAVTDAGLVNLQSLTGLNTLLLAKTKVTDAGLAHLQSLTGLTTLFLQETKITDAGLAHLQSLRGLTTLNLYGTRVTDAGVAHLKSTLPNCQIVS